jgi:hypothetical protein
MKMKGTAKTVVTLLDCISPVLDIVPVPGLQLAWKTFMALWDAVQQVIICGGSVTSHTIYLTSITTRFLKVAHSWKF